MKTARIKSNIYTFAIFLSFVAFFSCNRIKETTIKDIGNREKDTNHSPLVFNVVFETYGNKTLAYNKETISVDTLTWKNNEYDTVAYFNIELQNLKKEPFVIKTSLLATEIPFLIEYQKLKKVEEYTNGTKREYVNLNIVHQFNTVYTDSIIFKLADNADLPVLEQAFRVGYQKVGGRSLCELPAIWQRDTLDLSNPSNKHICCIEVK